MIKTIDEQIRSLQHLRECFGGEHLLLSFDKLVSEEDAAEFGNYDFEGVFAAIDFAWESIH